MGDEFYSSIKLITGEEIFALVLPDMIEDRQVLILQSPVIIKVITTSHGSLLKVKPWMQLPNDDIFVLNMDKVVTMSEITDESVIRIYHNYIEECEEEYQEKKDNYETKITDKMGYVSSVEEARKKLEDLFKGSKES